MGRWIFRAGVFVLLVGGFLGGLVVLAQWGLEQIRHQARYEIPFTSVNCPVPPTQSINEFLDEVQYLGSLPDKVVLLDPELPSKLEAAFLKHPWVERVEKVVLTPPKSVMVHVVYRRPVLAIWVKDGLRAVDGHGVLLRPDAPTKGLPIYEGKPTPPAGLPGTRWGDAGIEAQARLLRGK